MGKSNLSLETVGNTVVSCATPGTLADEDLGRLLRAIEAPGVANYLSVTMGVIAVSPTQRDRAKTVMTKVRTAAIIDNAIMRGVATVLVWLKADIKVFGPEQLGEAIAFLGVDGAPLRAAINRVKRECQVAA